MGRPALSWQLLRAVVQTALEVLGRGPHALADIYRAIAQHPRVRDAQSQRRRDMTTSTTQRPPISPAPASNDEDVALAPNDAKSLVPLKPAGPIRRDPAPSSGAFATAPIILHGAGGWETDVPDWMRAALPAARLKYLRDGGNPDLACDLDAVLYLMSASLCQPLGSDWTRIYLHIACKAVREFGHTELPDDDWVRDAEKPLSRYEQDLLDDLRGQIRRAQIRHTRGARRATRRAPQPQAAQGATEAPDENAPRKLSPAERGETFVVPTFGLDRDPKDPGPNGMPDDAFEAWAAALEQTSPAAIAKIRAERARRKPTRTTADASPDGSVRTFQR